MEALIPAAADLAAQGNKNLEDAFSVIKSSVANPHIVSFGFCFLVAII